MTRKGKKGGSRAGRKENHLPFLYNRPTYGKNKKQLLRLLYQSLPEQTTYHTASRRRLSGRRRACDVAVVVPVSTSGAASVSAAAAALVAATASCSSVSSAGACSAHSRGAGHPRRSPFRGSDMRSARRRSQIARTAAVWVRTSTVSSIASGARIRKRRMVIVALGGQFGGWVLGFFFLV